MTRRLRSRAVQLAAALLLVAAESASQEHSPGVWERAADPVIALDEKVHREVEALLMTLYKSREHWKSPFGQDQLHTALVALDAARADVAPDVRLRFDLGHVTSLLDDEKRAAPVLESALRDAPNHPLATTAYFSLGICYAKLGRPEAEIAAYDEYLVRETDPRDRVKALSNRAEAQMLLGRLGPAVTDYRASLVLEPDNVLTHWGLAVALDRSGDTPGGLVEAKAAITYDPLDQELTSRDVFFMPPYDIYWYEGIGAMARAQQIDDPATSILWWETAVAKWTEYLALATADDRWLPLAKAHQASCERQLDQAKKRAAHSPKPRRPRAQAPMVP
jgi:tetratricopeptide (TPR) repeat protein